MSTRTNSVDTTSTAELSQLLAESVELAESRNQCLAAVASQLRELHDRLHSGRFHLAVLGQCKRGKSTLLNALLGEDVLPSSVIPLTAIPTFLTAGRSREIVVQYQGRREAETHLARTNEEQKSILAEYVTEGRNPRNQLNVDSVEARLPAAIVEQGLVLVDTPGVGSTFRHNTEATLGFLSQCDAALFVISADPPITEIEVEFLRRVQEKVPRLFFIFNKTDLLEKDDLAAALHFLEQRLTETVPAASASHVFSVSAKHGLQAKADGSAELWEESGLEAVERHLIGFMAEEKHQALVDAVSMKASDLIAEALMRLDLEKQSLEMPIELLQSRLAEFERGIRQVADQRRRAGDMLAGDEKRMIGFLQEHAQRLRTDAAAHLVAVVGVTVDRADRQSFNEETIQAALENAMPAWFQRQSDATVDLFRDRVAEVLRPHQIEADAIIAGIRKHAAELFEIPYRAPESGRAFEEVRRPVWVRRTWPSSLSPLPQGFTDRFLPRGLRQRRILKRAERQIQSLVMTNVENLRWATHQNITESFRRFGTALDRRMAEVLESTNGAVRAALDERAKHDVKDRVTVLQESIYELGRIHDRLKMGCGLTKEDHEG